jgi:hypothetical protein
MPTPTTNTDQAGGEGPLTKAEVMALSPREKVYFVKAYFGVIGHRVATSHERRGYSNSGEFFRTWADAHRWLHAQRKLDLAIAEKQLTTAMRRLARCKTMRPPLEP